MTQDKVLSTTVVYTVDPSAIPYSNCEAGVFIELLESKLGLSAKLPDVDLSRMQQLGMKTSDLDLNELYSAIFKSDEPRISFTNGKYTDGSSGDYIISHAIMGSENIAVEVQGETEICEKVCSIIYDSFSSAAGLKSNWSTVQSQIAMKSYRTRTESFIGNSTNMLLNPIISRIFDENLEMGAKFGAKMMSRSKYDEFEPAQDVVSIWSLNEVNVRVSTFNKTTGRNESANINIDVRAKDDIGRGVVIVHSELPYEDHLSFTDMLRTSLSDDS